MRALMVCETPYQVVLACAIRMGHLGKKDRVDIVVTDTFPGAAAIVERLRHTDLFRLVRLGEMYQSVCANDLAGRIDKAGHLLHYQRFWRKLRLHGPYEQILLFNLDLFTQNVFLACRKQNHDLQVFRFEEGYDTYTRPEPKHTTKTQRLIALRERILHRPHLAEMVRGLYLLEPALFACKPAYPLLRINKDVIVSDAFREMMHTIFLPQFDVGMFDNKYVIFEESFFHDGIPVDDLSLYTQIIQCVGAENVMVKLHPRSRQDRFSALGVQVVPSQGIPAEALFIMGGFKGAVSIAIASGSIISRLLLLEEDTPSILLYKCIGGPIPLLDDAFLRFMEELQQMRGTKHLIVPGNAEALMRNLEQIGKGRQSGHE